MDELTLLLLAQWAYAANTDADDIPMTETERADLYALLDEVVNDPDYSDYFDAEQITTPPIPTLPRINVDKLKHVRDVVHTWQGNLAAIIKKAHKDAVQAAIQSLYDSYVPIGPGVPGGP